MMENDQITDSAFFWQFVGALFRWRRLLIFNSVAAAVLTLAIMLPFPNWYKSTASILPPEQESGVLGFASGLPSGLGSLLSGSGMTLPGLATPSDLYASILKSRAVCLGVVESKGLKAVYKSRFDQEAMDELLSRTSVVVQPDGIISLGYEDTDRQRAAAVTQSFIDELNKVNQENLVSKARSLREFVEQRLSENIRDLADAEEAYRDFQEKHFAVSLDEQVKAVIGAIADLRGQLTIAEIESGVMRKSLSPSNTRYQEQQYKIQQIKEQLAKLERGDSTQAESILNLPVKEAPELALQLARLTRDLKIQETIFELLKQQYEQAKIQELRDTPTIQVLDKPNVPNIKSRPKRVTMAILGGMLSFSLTLLAVLTLEFVRREKGRGSLAYDKMIAVTRMVNEDYFWLRNIFSRKRKDAP